MAVGGAETLAKLFEKQQNQPISRGQVTAVAPQLDPLKRLRRNGGARDFLDPKGIALLWGKGDRELIRRLNLGQVSDDEFISYTPRTKDELALIRSSGHPKLGAPPGL